MAVSDRPTEHTDFTSGLSGERRVSLLVDGPAGVQMVPLPPGQSVTIGRQADVSIPEAALSRQHARFTLAEGVVHVEDLGSTNGTWVNGTRVDQATITVDDKVALGPVSLSLHAMTPVAAQLQGLDNHDRFFALLEYEIERAHTFGRKVGLVMVRSADPDPDLLKHWCPRVRAQLRPIDRMALYGATVAEILIPEADAAHAHELAAQIIAGRGADAPELRCGVALFPDGATSAEELVSVCHRAAMQARAEQPVRAVTSGTRHLTVTPRALDDEEPGPLILSPKMIELFRTVDRLAQSAIPVLVVGETGTGKEVVACAIHERGARHAHPLRAINCGAIPQSLIESVLFGHQRGAFTGADRAAAGVFVDADRGTVFLDEIGELSQPAQVALLRVLETKTITPVGASRETKVDVRIIAATHQDLEAMCEQGTFRWDLLYRLNAMVLKVPPLRDRPEEIVPLAEHFLRQATGASPAARAVTGIDRPALAALQRYAWPGNVRQLRNVIERAVAIAPAPVITLADLPEKVQAAAAAPSPRPTGSAGTTAVASLAEIEERSRQQSGLQAGEEGFGEPLAEDGEEGGPSLLRDQVQRYAMALIRAALQQAEGSRADAAVLLGIPRRTLAHKIQVYGMRDDDPAGADDEQLLVPPPAGAASLPFKARVDRFEAEVLRHALQRCGGNQTQAAEYLGIPARTFRHKAQRCRVKG